MLSVFAQEPRKHATTANRVPPPPKGVKRERDNAAGALCFEMLQAHCQQSSNLFRAAGALAEPASSKARTERDPSTVKCFRCKKVGHMIKDCRSKE